MKVDGPHLPASGTQVMYLKKRHAMRDDGEGILMQPHATRDVPPLPRGRHTAVEAEKLEGEQAAMFRAGLGLAL